MSRRPRLAFCITELDPGGAERALVQIVTRLPQEEWDVKVFCLSGRGEMCPPLEEAGIPVECLGATSARSFRVIRDLRRRLMDFHPDLVQTFLFHANLAGRWAARGTGEAGGGPIVVSGLRVAERDAPWRARADRWTNRWVNMNVCVSEGVAEFARTNIRLPAHKVMVIPNGVDVEQLQQASTVDLSTFGIPPGSRVLTFVGRLHHQKGPDILLKAVSPILDAFPDVHLLIVGDGSERSTIERWLRESGESMPGESMVGESMVGERVHLAGRQPNVPGILKASHGLLLPSRWEGMPNVVLEAAAVGCPVVATDVEGVREILNNGRCGWVVPVGSIPQFSVAVHNLLTVPDERLRFSRESQQHVAEHFTWNVVAHKYAELYRQLLGCG